MTLRLDGLQQMNISTETSFLDYVRIYLDAVEVRLNKEITSEVLQVNALAGHVLSAGGKRLRPAMIALAACAVSKNPDIERVTAVGASAELVHMATLVHDDVVDDTTTRRGKTTANAVFGNGVAVLSGDFLLARAMCMLVADGDIRVIRAVTDITVEMSEGEVMELLAAGNPSITPEIYYEILRKKTAVFVAGCCRCGAMVGGASPEEEDALSRYGHHMGLAFQIADDLLDYTGNPTNTGKALGSDLRDGRATLPLLLALEDCSIEDRSLLLKYFGSDEITEDTFQLVLTIMEKHNTFTRTRATACTHIQRAADALLTLPATRARECFLQLNDYVIHRDR